MLRRGEIEEYIGLGHRSKGEYMKAASQLRSGERQVLHKDEFEALWAALQNGITDTEQGL